MAKLHLLATISAILWQWSAAVLPSVHYEVTEEQPPSAVVGNIVTDASLSATLGPAVLRELRFRITDENIAAHMFVIDPVTGILQTKGVLDREAICPSPSSDNSCTLSFDVAATRSNPDFYDVVAVTVDLKDVNDNTPAFPKAVYDLVIPESAIPPVMYNLPLAMDADSPPHSIQSYRLISQYDNFDLNVVEAAGAIRAIQLTLVKQVDRETRMTYEVSVAAEDGGPTPGMLLVNITVADANDHGPSFSQDSYVINVAEDTPVSMTLLQVKAEDSDVGINGRVYYNLAPASEQLLKQFSIDKTTGNIILRQPLDYETEPTHHLIVQAQDGGVNAQQAYCDVTIHVSDVNDQAPSITINTLAGTSRAEVSEVAERGQFVAHVSVRDTDTGPGGDFSCYSDNDQFQLRKLSQQRYELVTAAELDREVQETITVGVVCTDKGSPTLSASKQLVVAVQDFNDNAPVFPQRSYRQEIQENNQVNEVILQVTATDIDIGNNGKVTFSIKEDPNDYVTIDSRSGLIRANAVFDYENDHEIVFVVEAKDNGVPALSSSITVVLMIKDINDEPPRFAQELFTVQMYENQAMGAQIGSVQATDADSPPFDHIEYSLLQDHDFFTIDTLDGTIRAMAPLDRENSPRHVLLVAATNVNALPPLSSTATVQIDVLDVNDNAPVIDFPAAYNRSVALSNQVPVGYRAATIRAHDADMGNRATLHFALIGGNQEGYFDINRETGALTTAKVLASFELRTFTLTVSVSDGGFPPLGSETVLQIMVNKSIIYESHEALLSRNNVTIVVALSVVSAVIVVILLAAIVVIKTRDVRQRREKSRAFRYSIECEKNQAKREVSVLSDTLVNNKEMTSSDETKDSQKDVNIYANKHPSSGREMGSVASYQLHPSINELQKQGCRQSWASANNSNKPHLPPKQKRGSDLKQVGERPNANIQGDKRQSKRSSGDDSDSAYSGDMSNTDSGQGPSIDSYDYNHAHIPHHPPARPGSRPVQPPQYKDPKSKPRSIPQMIANNTHPCVNPTSPKRSNFRTRNAPQRQWNNVNNMTNTNNTNYTNTNTLSSLRSWESLPEDDASTTSGSYVVDFADLEDAENLSYAVTV